MWELGTTGDLYMDADLLFGAEQEMYDSWPENEESKTLWTCCNLHSLGMFSSCQMLLSHKLFCCQRAGNELAKWERGLHVVETSAPNVQFLTFRFCSVYLPIGLGGGGRRDGGVGCTSVSSRRKCVFRCESIMHTMPEISP